MFSSGFSSFLQIPSVLLSVGIYIVYTRNYRNYSAPFTHAFFQIYLVVCLHPNAEKYCLQFFFVPIPTPPPTNRSPLRSNNLPVLSNLHAKKISF